jgi:hypothetical protein
VPKSPGIDPKDDHGWTNIRAWWRWPPPGKTGASAIAPRAMRDDEAPGHARRPITCHESTAAARRAGDASSGTEKVKRAPVPDPVRHWPLQALGFHSAWNPQDRR